MKNFLIIFAILFLLKVTNIVTWSWWIITLPLYFVPGVITVIAFLIACCVAIDKIFE